MENLKIAPTEAELAGKAIKPRVTVCDVEDAILGEYYMNPSDLFTDEGDSRIRTGLSCLTICVLVLKNGFTVTGESACADPDNFDFEIGARIARKNAIDKIWPLLGFQLKTKLHDEWDGEKV